MKNYLDSYYDDELSVSEIIATATDDDVSLRDIVAQLARDPALHGELAIDLMERLGSTTAAQALADEVPALTGVVVAAHVQQAVANDEFRFALQRGDPLPSLLRQLDAAGFAPARRVSWLSTLAGSFDLATIAQGAVNLRTETALALLNRVLPAAGPMGAIDVLANAGIDAALIIDVLRVLGFRSPAQHTPRLAVAACHAEGLRAAGCVTDQRRRERGA
jgi:hypothetical protein